MCSEQEGNRNNAMFLKVMSENLPRGFMNSNKYCNKPLQT